MAAVEWRSPLPNGQIGSDSARRSQGLNSSDIKTHLFGELWWITGGKGGISSHGFSPKCVHSGMPDLYKEIIGWLWKRERDAVTLSGWQGPYMYMVSLLQGLQNTLQMSNWQTVINPSSTPEKWRIQLNSWDECKWPPTYGHPSQTEWWMMEELLPMCQWDIDGILRAPTQGTPTIYIMLNASYPRGSC